MGESVATVGVTGFNHAGFVVTDLDAAVRFCVDHLGARDCDRYGVARDDHGNSVADVFGVHPRATARFAFVAWGETLVELLEWSAPDQRRDQPGNSDFGGRHLALWVDDLAACVAALEVLDNVVPRTRNERFVYAATGFGLELQLVQR